MRVELFAVVRSCTSLRTCITLLLEPCGPGITIDVLNNRVISIRAGTFINVFPAALPNSMQDLTVSCLRHGKRFFCKIVFCTKISMPFCGC
jgi:hypothetical protein